MWRSVSRSKLFALSILVLSAGSAFGQEDPAEIARATIDRMGGMDAWHDLELLVWDIFGESHYWDKWTGDFRWERDSLIVIMDLDDRDGSVWIESQPIKGDKERELLDQAYARWVNNSYWFIMPFKLLDPGVMLDYLGRESVDGSPADVLELTFDSVGLTPRNKYHIYVCQDSGLVCQWSYFTDRDDEEPRFTGPWTAWKKYDGIWLSTGRGDERTNVSDVHLPDTLPEHTFEGPEAVVLP